MSTLIGCGSDPSADISVLSLHACDPNLDLTNAVIEADGSFTEVPLVPGVGTGFAPTCLKVRNDTSASMFIHRIEGVLRCESNGFVDPDERSLARVRVDDLICDARRLETLQYLVEAEQSADVPFAVPGDDVFRALDDWFMELSPPRLDPFSLPFGLSRWIRLDVQLSVTSADGEILTPTTRLPFALCPRNCPTR